MEVFLKLQTKPKRLTDWLEKNYPNKRTRESFHVSLKNWIKCFYGKDSVTNYLGINISLDREAVKRNVEERINEIEEGIEKYLSELDDRDFTDDFKTFLNWARNEGYANNNIHKMSSKAKTFFSRQDPRCNINKEDWSDIKRTLLPKSKRATTQDDILTKEQLRKVLPHLSIQAKALALFLLSTGTRISAAIQLKMSDINLDSDPPEVNIRAEYTKGGVGGRFMWFSEEARDAIIEWHKDRIFKNKPGRPSSNADRSYDENLVFNFTKRGFTLIWNRALKRADGRRVTPVLAKRDPSTKAKTHVYHVHTLRKFFSTNMNLAKVPYNVVQAWMGHKAYLAEAYDRFGKRTMAEIYKEYMDVVTVSDLSIDDKLKKEFEEAKKQAEEDKEYYEGFFNQILEILKIDKTMDSRKKRMEVYRKLIKLNEDSEELELINNAMKIVREKPEIIQDTKTI